MNKKLYDCCIDELLARRQAETALQDVGINFEYDSDILGKYFSNAINLTEKALLTSMGLSIYTVKRYSDFLGFFVDLDYLSTDGGLKYSITYDNFVEIFLSPTVKDIAEDVWEALVEHNDESVEHVNKTCFNDTIIGYMQTITGITEDYHNAETPNLHEIYEVAMKDTRLSHEIDKRLAQIGLRIDFERGAFGKYFISHSIFVDEAIRTALRLHEKISEVKYCDYGIQGGCMMPVLYPQDDNVELSLLDENLDKLIDMACENEYVENAIWIVYEKNDVALLNHLLKMAYPDSDSKSN